MSDGTAIEWTDATWNPVTGCTRVSPGCGNCYIERTPPFRMEGRRFERVGNEETTGVRLHPERLGQPLRWRKPRRVFVCSLADLFHEEVPRQFQDRVFAAMALSPHVFQVLTKRPERALSYFRTGRPAQRVSYCAFDLNIYSGIAGKLGRGGGWPLPNVWIGVSIENARYTWRADVLRKIPAAVRFISAEPLLGSLYQGGSSYGPLPDMRLTGAASASGRPVGGGSAALPQRLSPQSDGAEHARTNRGEGADPRAHSLDLTGIDWVICGGESGPGARPMHPKWARELRDACLAACPSCHGTGRHASAHPGAPGHGWDGPCGCERPAFFFKQWGEWGNGSSPGVTGKCDIAMAYDGSYVPFDRLWDETLPERRRWLQDGNWPHLVRMSRVGKKAAGRLLDGREWNEMP